MEAEKGEARTCPEKSKSSSWDGRWNVLRDNIWWGALKPGMGGGQLCAESYRKKAAPREC